MKIDNLIIAVKHRILQLKKVKEEKNFLFYSTEEKEEWLRKQRMALTYNRSYLGWLIRKRIKILKREIN
jgi:hypothetical protein